MAGNHFIDVNNMAKPIEFGLILKGEDA